MRTAVTTRSAERALVGAVVLLAHALLLWAWPRSPLRDTARTREPITVAVTLLPTPAPPPIAVPAPRATDVPAAAQRPARAPRSQPSPKAAPGAATTPTEAPPSMTAPTPAAPAASAATALELRLVLPRGAAERGGLTEPPNSMRRQALNDPRSNVQPDPTQVLPNAVAASAKGDCIKGEYFGGGMGLLSAPFLAYAAAAGNCKPQR
jgi:hypothetical protein